MEKLVASLYSEFAFKVRDGILESNFQATAIVMVGQLSKEMTFHTSTYGDTKGQTQHSFSPFTQLIEAGIGIDFSKVIENYEKERASLEIKRVEQITTKKTKWYADAWIHKFKGINVEGVKVFIITLEDYLTMERPGPLVAISYEKHIAEIRYERSQGSGRSFRSTGEWGYYFDWNYKSCRYKIPLSLVNKFKEKVDNENDLKDRKAKSEKARITRTEKIVKKLADLFGEAWSESAWRSYGGMRGSYQEDVFYVKQNAEGETFEIAVTIAVSPDKDDEAVYFSNFTFKRLPKLDASQVEAIMQVINFGSMA